MSVTTVTPTFESVHVVGRSELASHFSAGEKKFLVYAELVKRILGKYHPLPLTSSEIVQEAQEMGYEGEKTRYALKWLRRHRGVSWAWCEGKLHISLKGNHAS